MSKGYKVAHGFFATPKGGAKRFYGGTATTADLQELPPAMLKDLVARGRVKEFNVAPAKAGTATKALKPPPKGGSRGRAKADTKAAPKAAAEEKE